MAQVRHNTARRRRRQRDGGYLLLAIMLMMTMMIIAATIAAPRVVQQMKRDREEEMIHRGTQYARAIKKFYKKNGRYPATLDDLDKGQIRYLRKRYTDPLTKSGKWKLLNYGDIATLLNTNAPGTPAAALGTLGGAGGLTPGGAISPGAGGAAANFPGGQQVPQQFAQQPGLASFNSNSDQGGNPEGVPSGNFGGNAVGSDQGFSAGSDQGAESGNQPGNNGQPGAGNQPGGSIFASSGPGGQTFGGGAIVGVASTSKDPTIRIYNKKKKYNEWVFIYNPMMDQQNVLLRGPYQPTTIGGAQVGTPASQLNGQQQQNSPFGQQNNGGFGQQPSSGFGQQGPQQLQPGGVFPPDQSSQ